MNHLLPFTYQKFYKKTTFIVLLFLVFFRSEAQKLPSLYSFKGFHVGITGQADFIQKPTFFG
jgi:hypothetical protein